MKFKLDDYIPKSSQAKLRVLLENERYLHSVGVAITAAFLAKKYGVSVKNAVIAGFFHDCAKGLSVWGLKNSIKKYNIKMNDSSKQIPGLWHGIVSAYMAKDIFGINNTEILEAITYHSTGKKSMSTLAKIIYVSDYIELGREYASSKKTRNLIKNKKISLNKFVLKVIKEKLIYLINSSMIIHSDSIELFNYLLGQKAKN